MKKIYVKAAIFDLDGTLINSKRDIIDSALYMLSALGIIEKTREEIQACIGFGKDRLISGALGSAATPEMINRANGIFGEHYNKHMFDTTKLYPGVLEVLDYLRNKVLFMVTNKNRSVTIKTLEYFGIDKYFDEVIGGDDVNCRKPDACPINNLMKKRNISKSEAIMIGDSDIDIKTGKNAGIFTCGLTGGIGKREDVIKAGPDYTLDEISKLKEIIH